MSKKKGWQRGIIKKTGDNGTAIWNELLQKNELGEYRPSGEIQRAQYYTTGKILITIFWPVL